MLNRTGRRRRDSFDGREEVLERVNDVEGVAEALKFGGPSKLLAGLLFAFGFAFDVNRAAGGQENRKIFDPAFLSCGLIHACVPILPTRPLRVAERRDFVVKLRLILDRISPAFAVCGLRVRHRADHKLAAGHARIVLEYILRTPARKGVTHGDVFDGCFVLGFSNTPSFLKVTYLLACSFSSCHDRPNADLLAAAWLSSPASPQTREPPHEASSIDILARTDLHLHTTPAKRPATDNPPQANKALDRIRLGALSCRLSFHRAGSVSLSFGVSGGRVSS